MEQRSPVDTPGGVIAANALVPFLFLRTIAAVRQVNKSVGLFALAICLFN